MRGVPAGKDSPKAMGRIRVIVRPDARCEQYVVARIDFFKLGEGG